jgi:hypothetical protein
MSDYIKINTNSFQKWLIEQGYYRENGDGAWMKDGLIVSGKELNNKLNEWKMLSVDKNK